MEVGVLGVGVDEDAYVYRVGGFDSHKIHVVSVVVQPSKESVPEGPEGKCRDYFYVAFHSLFSGSLIVQKSLCFFNVVRDGLWALQGIARIFIFVGVDA